MTVYRQNVPKRVKNREISEKKAGWLPDDSAQLSNLVNGLALTACHINAHLSR
jgi:hypothetical protein